MHEFIEPYVPPAEKSKTTGFFLFLQDKVNTYYKLKKIEHWNEFQDGTVLDLGCGYGQYMEEAPKRINVVGINLNDEEIKIARKKGLKVIKADCRKLPLKTNSIDGVNCSHLVEHIENPIEILKEAHRVLKKDGIIVVRTPDIVRHFEHFYDDPSHINPFTSKKLEKILKYAGFKEIKIGYGLYISNYLKVLTLLPRVRVEIEKFLARYFSHEIIAIARK